MALQNMVGNFAGIVAPIVTGFVVDQTGEYVWAFALSAVTAVLAGLAWAFGVRRVIPIDWDHSSTSGTSRYDAVGTRTP
jgi:ACS family glucarate transporter-like MFS transporter